MGKRAGAVVLLAVLLAAAAVPGCSRQNQAGADAQFTMLYAELMLLNEREKTAAVSDSAYQLHVAEVLRRNGTTEEAFRDRSNELMRDDRAWRDFLGRVSLVFDSIKTARALPPKKM